MKLQKPNDLHCWIRFLVLLMPLGACVPEEQSGQVEQINACSLLTAQDIAMTTNAEVSEGYREDTGLIGEGEQAGVYSSTCIWQINPGGSDLEYVILMAMSWPAGKPAEQFLQSFWNSSAHGVIEQKPVPLDLGDAALWWGDGVAVAKEQTSFGISTRLVGAREKRRTAEEALAAIIVAQL